MLRRTTTALCALVIGCATSQRPRLEPQAQTIASAPRPASEPRKKGEPMLTVMSKDGTAIAYAKTGQGRPLVVVHGTTADHTRWAPILPELEKRFTVYAVDRRGRGASGDAKGYAIEREFEDVAAVVVT